MSVVGFDAHTVRVSKNESCFLSLFPLSSLSTSRNRANTRKQDALFGVVVSTATDSAI
jgi:hypothetical protein